MIRGSLQIDGVEIEKVFLPETHREIKYGQYLDFAMLTNDINSWLSKQIEEKREYGNQYRVKLAYATATIYNIDAKKLLRIQHDGIGFLESAFSMINNLISTFEPQDNAGAFTVIDDDNVEHVYSIPELTQSVFRGSNSLPRFTFQQLVEISETERILDSQMKKIDANQKDHTEFKGTVVSKAMQKSYQTYENTIKKIVLCVTPFDQIPVDDTFDLWMETEMRRIKNISMVDALNTIFFLGGIPKNYGILIDLGFISNISKLLNIEMNRANNTPNELPTLAIVQNEYEI